jgi:hypothetical protein
MILLVSNLYAMSRRFFLKGCFKTHPKVSDPKLTFLMGKVSLLGTDLKQQNVNQLTRCM